MISLQGRFKLNKQNECTKVFALPHREARLQAARPRCLKYFAWLKASSEFLFLQHFFVFLFDV